MKEKPLGTFTAVVLSLALLANSASACTWAAFANGNAAVVARTMDWYCDDNAVVKGHGRGVAVTAADTPNALRYTAKYASLQVHSFDVGLVIEGMNEKGLQGSILFLEGSELPDSKAGRKDIDPGNFIAYAVSNFATVDELVAGLDALNFIGAHMNIPAAGGEILDYDKKYWPGHFAFADAGGDKAVIEFIRGGVTVYHGREYDAMTNEPSLEVHLALDDIGYQPNGTISTVDRRARAKSNMRDMYERGVETPQRALLAMRGVLASVFAGSEEIDRAENEVYPTIWSTLADLKNPTYYLSRAASWGSEIYDFSQFAVDKPEVAALRPKAGPYADIAVENAE